MAQMVGDTGGKFAHKLGGDSGLENVTAHCQCYCAFICTLV